MFFSVITKNLNWEIYIYILLKDGMGLRMKNCKILWVHWKIQFLEGGGSWKANRRGLPKKEGLGQFADLRGS